MKDTQGNNITEEEFTKDIGHRAESHHYCCATQENEGDCNCKVIVNTSETNCKPPVDEEDSWQKKFVEKFVCNTDPEEHPFVAFYDEEENKFEFWNAYKLISFIKEVEDKAYKLGKCVGVTEEQERWSEIVKMIKGRGITNIQSTNNK